MRHVSVLALILICLLAGAGCGRHLAGTYHADVRLQPGAEQSSEPGYTLSDVQSKLRADPRTIVLKSGGRYEMRRADFIEEGDWRVEGDRLFLRGDTSNGVHVQPALRKDRTFRLGAAGEIIDDGSYGHYNLELVYERE